MKNKKLIIIVAIAILLVLGIVGATYAWFQATITGNYTINSDTANMDIITKIDGILETKY